MAARLRRADVDLQLQFAQVFVVGIPLQGGLNLGECVRHVTPRHRIPRQLFTDRIQTGHGLLFLHLHRGISHLNTGNQNDRFLVEPGGLGELTALLRRNGLVQQHVQPDCRLRAPDRFLLGNLDGIRRGGGLLGPSAGRGEGQNEKQSKGRF